MEYVINTSTNKISISMGQVYLVAPKDEVFLREIDLMFPVVNYLLPGKPKVNISNRHYNRKLKRREKKLAEKYGVGAQIELHEPRYECRSGLLLTVLSELEKSRVVAVGVVGLTEESIISLINTFEEVAKKFSKTILVLQAEWIQIELKEFSILNFSAGKLSYNQWLESVAEFRNW